MAEEAQQAAPDDVVKRAAPTGVAAHSINGRTLHALLKLPINLRTTNFDDVSDANISQIKRTFRYYKYLSIG